MSQRYVLRRLFQLLPAVLGIVVVGFLLVQLAPGDPIVALAGQDGDEAFYERTRERYGLDDSVPVQLVRYGQAVLTGDLGTSIAQRRPVVDLVLERLPATLLLTATSLVLSTVMGVGLGVFMARRGSTATDTATNSLLLTVHAAPDFWLAQLTLLGLAGGLSWFPVQGMTTAGSDATGLGAAADVAYHLVLPALVLATSQLALVTRMTRVSLLEELASPHITAARARGLSERRVVYVHALRRAMLPVTTIVGGRVGHLLAGTVVVEIVFSWPGLGRLLLTSMQSRDQPVILGMFLVVAFSVVVGNLVTDLAYAWLDPRIQYDE